MLAFYLQRAHHPGCERSAVACMRLLCVVLRGTVTAPGHREALQTLLPPLLLPWLHLLSRPPPPAVVPHAALRWVFELLARLLQLSARKGLPLVGPPGAPRAGAPRALLTGQPLPPPQLQGAMHALWEAAAVAAVLAVAEVAHVAGGAVERLLQQLGQVGCVG